MRWDKAIRSFSSSIRNRRWAGFESRWGGFVQARVHRYDRSVPRTKSGSSAVVAVTNRKNAPFLFFHMTGDATQGPCRRRRLKYSFRGKSRNDVRKVIAGPTMYLSASRLRGRFSKVLASCSNQHILPEPNDGSGVDLRCDGRSTWTRSSEERSLPNFR